MFRLRSVFFFAEEMASKIAKQSAVCTYWTASCISPSRISLYLHEGYVDFLLFYRMSFPDQLLHFLRSASHLQPMDVKYIRH